MVSVIVPIYKSENTLPLCIESILSQTYTDFELLLIDDGSPDNCGKICDEYAEQDRRIRVIHKANGGVSSARNCGMDNMKGEYFACVDSDDVVAPCYLEDLVTTQENHPEFGHVLCGFYCVSQKKNYVLTTEEELSVVDRKDYMRLADCVLTQAPWLHLYETEIVQRNKLRMREDLSLAEDLTFNLEYLDALENTTIGVINKPNYVYQDENVESLYHRYKADLLEIKEMVNSNVKNHLIKWNVTDDNSWERYNNSVYYSYVSVLDNTFIKENPMTQQEKTAYNNTVLQKESFREALNKCTVSITPAMKKAYLSGDYRQVLQVKRLEKLRSFVRGIVNV